MVRRQLTAVISCAGILAITAVAVFSSNAWGEREGQISQASADVSSVVDASSTMLYPGTPMSRLQHEDFTVQNPNWRWPNPNGTNPPLGTNITITYSYSGFDDSNLSCSDVRAAVEEALGLWAAYAPLDFVEIADTGVCPDPNDGSYSAGSSANLRFGTHSFDGQFGVLAHAYFPSSDTSGLPGDLHFDCGENWDTAPGSGGVIDFLEVAVHEIGHALGLGHEETLDAIMNPFYGGRYSGLGTGFLLQDDIDGIRAIYGSGTGSVTPLGSSGCGSCSDGCATTGCLVTRLAQRTLAVPGFDDFDELIPIADGPIPEPNFDARMSLIHTVRQFRDRMLMQSVTGRELSKLYYSYDGEMNRLFLRRPDLGVEAISVVMATLPAMQQSLADETRVLTIETKLYERGRKLISQIRRAADPDLEGVLGRVDAFLDQQSRSVGATTKIEFGEDRFVRANTN